ncbi:MAG: hypothetical protein Q8L34_02655 [Candidatus Woesearchaeota archaeon]|nr:hypothetical protein [Candidatus Woesearchaeota archaeon]
MPRKQQLLPETRFALLFQTVPPTTLLSLAPDTHWHILRRKDGIYLQQVVHGTSQPFHQLNSYPDPAIALHKHLSIKTRINAFTIYLHDSNLVTYSSDGVDYTPLAGARDFVGPGEHHFKCGSLEFLLSFQSQ